MDSHFKKKCLKNAIFALSIFSMSSVALAFNQAEQGHAALTNIVAESKSFMGSICYCLSGGSIVMGLYNFIAKQSMMTGLGCLVISLGSFKLPAWITEASGMLL